MAPRIETFPIAKLNPAAKARLNARRVSARRQLELDVMNFLKAMKDYVVQAKGAFDQAVSGLHQADRHGIRIEIRIVLHRLTVSRLTRLAEFIFRNLPFVEHVALMGLEFVGYTARNIDELWIDPFDYQSELAAAVRFLAERGMTASIYNHQLCVLRPELWAYAKKSISDWKNLYLPACERCSRRNECGGLFQWVIKKHSDHIHALV